MKKTLEVLNRLIAEKVIRDYAIGGAMGALWYMEAITTMDLDIFVLSPDETSLDPIGPIYKRLKELGHVTDPDHAECINIEGVPVQFLPVYNELLKDAMCHARGFDYEGVPTKVLSAEHLAAISVQTGRMKDKLRVEMFLRSAKFEKGVFLDILNKAFHGVRPHGTRVRPHGTPRVRPHRTHRTTTLHPIAPEMVQY